MTALNISFSFKGYNLHCFHDIFVFGPAQLDLYILTDGALPLPAHLLSRIVANVLSNVNVLKLVSFFACVLYVPVTSRFVMLYKYLF